MAKIGQDTRLKQSDKGPYHCLGIAKTDEGYELRKLKIDGATVENVKVIHKCTERAEIMQVMQIELSSYTINFNEKETK